MSDDILQRRDWAFASEEFDAVNQNVGSIDLANLNEAKTRYSVINDIIRKVLGWKDGQVETEEHTSKSRRGYVDYILRVGDSSIIIEAKKVGASFPVSTRKQSLKLNGSVLGKGEISEAIIQAENYAQDKNADIVCVTNGLCWCIFQANGIKEDGSATLLFPFEQQGHAEMLFNLLSEDSVRNGSIDILRGNIYKSEDRLLTIIRDADDRLNRNTIADYITPALNEAFYNDALLTNVEALEKCFVETEARTRFDSQLGMHLSDSKPKIVDNARRIRRGKQNGPLENIISLKPVDHAPPVTLIIGPVGAGKTTYLKHFEMVSGKKILDKEDVHWIYIDFEEMGKAGKPRKFIYKKLQDYFTNSKRFDFKSIVEPAYREELIGLKRGPLSLIANDEAEIKRRLTDYIEKDFREIEPYVDKLFKYLVRKNLCVLVMDNVDLYEDEELETSVFAEGLALSKRLTVNVIVCMRDKTFVDHRNSPTLNAYEIRKLWIDPPPFKSVLSNRLSYSKKILKNKSAQIPTEKGMHINVPDLSVFFEIVQRSILQGNAGQFIDNVSDLNIRKGLEFTKNFLTSGHIHADKALKTYLQDGSDYYFPFHEVFKGTALGQWKYYKEERAECVNLFDSRLGVKKLRLLRLIILNYLSLQAGSTNTVEVAVKECQKIFRSCGASDEDTLAILEFLRKHALVRTSSSSTVTEEESVSISRSGGYYLKFLSKTFVYAEQCLYDTAIEDIEYWKKLSDATVDIETRSHSVGDRMLLRRKRMADFVNYLEALEKSTLENSGYKDSLNCINAIGRKIMDDVNIAVKKSNQRYIS